MTHFNAGRASRQSHARQLVASLLLALIICSVQALAPSTRTQSLGVSPAFSATLTTSGSPGARSSQSTFRQLVSADGNLRTYHGAQRQPRAIAARYDFDDALQAQLRDCKGHPYKYYHNQIFFKGCQVTAKIEAYRAFHHFAHQGVSLDPSFLVALGKGCLEAAVPGGTSISTYIKIANTVKTVILPESYGVSCAIGAISGVLDSQLNRP